MIVDRQFPDDWQSLVDIVKRATTESRVVAIHSGHFLLYYDADEGRAVPCIASEMKSSKYDAVREELAEFPLLSWKLACRLAASLPSVSHHLLTIVNDWQYVPTGFDRKKFYGDFVQLPDSYIAEASQLKNVNARLLTPEGSMEFSASQPYFSERALRNQYHRRIRRLIKQQALPAGVELNLGEGGTTCSLLDMMGRKREVYCSSKDADCSNEVAELIHQSSSLIGCDTFINLYPAVCKEFVELGSELPARLFGTPVSRIINLALPATGVATESDLYDGAEMAIHKMM